MPLILRQTKGSKLTIQEMDDNLLWVNNLTEVTYTELVNLIDTNDLVPGQHYLITDFQTCYDRPDYDQNRDPIAVSLSSYIQGPVEPIVVLATSTDTLAINAYQPAYPNDKIKYDVTYSSTESAEPAFGRITERFDNYNNRTDYDHRTIEFKRYRFYTFSRETPETGTIELLNDGTVNGTDTLFTNYTVGQVIAYPNSVEGFFKIASIDSDTLMTVSGLSINSFGGSGEFYIANSETYDSYYKSNVDDPTDFNLYTTFGDAIDDSRAINNYIGDYSNLHIEDSEGDFLFANNVFKDGECNNNNIGNGSYNNTFNDDCNNNKIGNYCYNNITNNDFDGNVIGNFFTNNLITADFQYNHVGEDFANNTIINTDFDFRNNRIGNDFTNNWIDSSSEDDFDRNQIGDLFENNTIFRNFEDNTIGNGFNGNEIYQDFYDNDISNDFNNNTIGDFEDIGAGIFEDNVIGNNFKGNSTLGLFTHNQIGNDFVSNGTEDDFISNVIGNNANANNISADFAYNKIGNGFQNNTVANDFGFGGGVPRGNVIGNDFQNNTIGEYFYDNTIGDNFGANNIGDNFTNNQVAYGFISNTIGFDFQNNDIKVSISAVDFAASQGIVQDPLNQVNTPNGVDGIYTGITPSTSNSTYGTGISFNITVSSNQVSSVVVNNGGQLYAQGDVLTVAGSLFGGVDGVDDLTIIVVNRTVPFTTRTFSCTVIEDANQVNRLYFIDAFANPPIIVVGNPQS
jgi:hypothetical protein